MARYGTFKYGDGTKYGPGALETLLYGLWVDWNDDGAYPELDAGTNNEAYQRLSGWTSRRGRQEFLRDSDQGGFSPYMVGEATLTLDNHDDRYNPLNTASPLYPNVAEGRFAKFFVKHGSTGETYDIITGQIQDIELVGRGESAQAIVTIVDGWRWLRDDEISVALQQNVSTTDAINDVLDATNWPAIWGRDIAIAAETIPYHWEDGRSPSAALKDLADSEYGRLYVANDGALTFRSRHAIEESVVTFNEENTLKDVGLSNPFKSRRDKVTIRVFPRVAQSSAVVWELQDTPLVTGGDTDFVLWASYASGGTPAPVLSPSIASTDFATNTSTDGGGSNTTTDFSAALTSFGQRGKVVVANESSSDSYITALRIRGQAITSPNESLVIAGAGNRNFNLSLPWQQTVNFANDLADFLVDLLNQTAPRPILQVEERPDIQFLPDLTEQVTASFPTLVINADYRVGYIEHQSLDENCEAVRTVFYLEPFADLSGFWTFPVEIGVDSVFAL